VLIADDQDLFRGGFAMILDAQSDITVVGEAADGDEAVCAASALRPDVVLMDVRMPGMDGIEATRRICAISSVKVLVLTMFDLDEYVYDALRARRVGFSSRTSAVTNWPMQCEWSRQGSLCWHRR